MNLQPRTDSITNQKEFLHTTQGTIAKVGGVTIKSASFTPDASGYLKAGSAVVIEAGTGLAIPFVDGTATPGLAYVTQNDVRIDQGVNPVVGALEEAYLKASVVQNAEAGRTLATTAFVTHSGGRFKVR